MVLYNEHNPDDEAIGAVVKADLRTRPDALIVVGTTLKVPGVKRIVKEMCGVVRGRRDGATIWINMDTPPVSKDYEWDLIVKGPCDRVANVASMRHWYEPLEEQITNEQVQKVLEETRVEVVVFSPSKNNRMEELSLPTPTSSRSCSVPLPQLVPLIADEKQKKRKMQSKLKEPKPEKPKQQTKRVRKNPAPKTGPANNAMKINFKTSKAGPQVNGKDSKPAQPMQPVSPSHAKNNTLPPISQLPIFSDAFPVFQRTPVKLHEQPESAAQSPITSAPQSRRSSDPRMEISFLSNPSP
jgi:NAD-dependent histone deacetylase SIR2